MEERAQLIEQVEAKIGGRSLIWFGTRGIDADPLHSIRQFDGVYSLIARLGNPSWQPDQEVCLEDVTHTRVDLNRYTIDDDLSDAAAFLHNRMMMAIGEGALVAAYRSCHFLSAASFARLGSKSVLSLFFGIQSAFDHKPWVETQLQSCGIRTIPWDYYSDYEWDQIRERAATGPLVLRASYSDGGTGLRLITAGSTLPTAPPRVQDRLIAVSRYLNPNVPLNVSGCVWPSGRVTLHAPSAQLIGFRELTQNIFGYCGNDFSSLTSLLSDSEIDQLEQISLAAGTWLHSAGYRGAFGVDAVLYRGQILLTEVNPRFQGCSATGAEVSKSLGLTDVYLDHLGAFLGIEPGAERPSLREMAREQAHPSIAKSHITCYASDGPMRLKPDAGLRDMPGAHIKGVPSEARLLLAEDSMLFKLVIDGPALVSNTPNPSLEPSVRNQVVSLKSRMFEVMATGDPRG